MTSTGIQVEGATKGSEGRPVSRVLSLSVASGEMFGVLGANGAGRSTAVDNVPASRHHHDGGRIRVREFDPAERRMPVRHLVIFPARVL
jgi:ABC-2 type transport system ATP-binding protein